MPARHTALASRAAGLLAAGCLLTALAPAGSRAQTDDTAPSASRISTARSGLGTWTGTLDRDDSTLHYLVSDGSVLYAASDSTRPYLSLAMREPIWVLENGGRWARVRTRDGALGLVSAKLIANTWIVVSKSSQTVFIYRGDRLAARIPADLGFNFFADKQVRGSPGDPDNWRTPEGVFHVASKNPGSKFHRALVLNYPNGEDAERGLADRLISADEYQAIVGAEKSYGMPPMGTPLGGWIEIHGRGTGQRSNWTEGCIAIPDDEIDRIWDWIHVGTPVIIER